MVGFGFWRMIKQSTGVWGGMEFFGLVHGSRRIGTPPAANSRAEPLETSDGLLLMLIKSAMPSFCVAGHVEGAELDGRSENRLVP